MLYCTALGTRTDISKVGDEAQAILACPSHMLAYPKLVPGVVGPTPTRYPRSERPWLWLVVAVFDMTLTQILGVWLRSTEWLGWLAVVFFCFWVRCGQDTVCTYTMKLEDWSISTSYQRGPLLFVFVLVFRFHAVSGLPPKT